MDNPILKPLDPSRFLLIAVLGWMSQHQLKVIDYLREERVLRDQLGARRLRLSDDQRRRLAAKAKLLGRLWSAKTCGPESFRDSENVTRGMR